MDHRFLQWTLLPRYNAPDHTPQLWQHQIVHTWCLGWLRQWTWSRWHHSQTLWFVLDGLVSCGVARLYGRSLLSRLDCDQPGDEHKRNLKVGLCTTLLRRLRKRNYCNYKLLKKIGFFLLVLFWKNGGCGFPLICPAVCYPGGNCWGRYLSSLCCEVPYFDLRGQRGQA